MSSTTTEETEPVEPRFSAQFEGDGFADARELLLYNGKRQPIQVQHDTFTHQNVIVYMARATGDPAVFWVLRPEGEVKVRLSTARYETVDPETITLKDMSKIIVPGDTGVYRRLRSQPDQPRLH